MTDHPIDRVARVLGTGADRRRLVKGLGALTLGVPALMAAGRASAADSNEHQRQCHDRCRRECEDRNDRHDRHECEDRCRQHC